MNHLSHFVFEGTAYEQGLAHGESLRDSIKNNISIYIDRFENAGKIKKEMLLKNAHAYFVSLEETNKEYINGMLGISNGSNIDIIEIAMLNLRYELLYDALGKQYLENSIDGCTSFAILPKITKNNNLIIGQNWDWIPNIECVLTTSIDEDGLQRISFTEAGIFAGKPGMNSYGIGLTVNGLHTMDDDWKRLYKPFHMRCYEILRSKKIDKAINVLTGSPRSCTANFMIGKSSKNILNIELAPNNKKIIYPKSGFLCHANHIINTSAMNVIEPPNPRRYLSVFRKNQMDLLLKKSKLLTVKKIQKILKNHQNKPDSICRHKDKKLSNYHQIITKTSMIMDLSNKYLWATNGPPCKSNFNKFSFI